MSSTLGVIQPYTRCRSGDVASFVLLLPSKDHVEDLVSSLGEFEVRTRVEGREPFFTLTGKYKVIDLTIASTGIGAPSLALALEEYVRLGGRVFIKVGFATGMQSRVTLGDVVLAMSAVRADGTSRYYAPIEYPAHASYELLWYAKEIFKTYTRIYDHEMRYHIGLTLSLDVLVGLEEAMRTWAKTDVLVADMETATLYTLAGIKRLKALSILVVDSSIPHGVMPGDIERSLERSSYSRRISERLLAAARLAAEILVRIREEYRYQREVEERVRDKRS